MVGLKHYYLMNKGQIMQHKSIFILTFLFTFPVIIYAAGMKRSTMTSCEYQAGTASEIQTIRQNEGDDWSEFEQNIKKIYKDGQGRDDLLVIAQSVYQQPINTLPITVHDQTFSACVKRTQEAEMAAEG